MPYATYNVSKNFFTEIPIFNLYQYFIYNYPCYCAILASCKCHRRVGNLEAQVART